MIFSKKQPEAKKTFDLTMTPFNLPLAPDKASKSQMENYANWVYPNVYAIAEPTANMEFKLMQMTGKEVNEIDQHPVLELLNRFNPFMTKYQVLFTTVAHKKLVGEAAWYIVRLGTKPTEIYPIRPDFIDVVPGDLGKGEFVKHYVYKIDGKETIIPPENLIFHKEVNPLNPYRGYGAVQAASTIIDVDNMAREWNKNLMYNAGNVGGVFSTEGRLDDSIIKRIKDQLKKEYQGFKNAGKYMVLEGGLKLEQEPKNPQELDFNTSRINTRDEIAAMFRNPKPVLGITDDVNRANAEATEYVHSKNVIKNEMSKLCEDLNEYLLPMFGVADNMFITFEDPVPENEAADVDKYFKLVNKVFTVNEAREEFELDPLDDPKYDELQAPVSPVNAVNEDGNPQEGNKPQKPPKKPTKPEKPTQGQRNYKIYKKDVQRLLNIDADRKIKQAKFDEVLMGVIGKMITKSPRPAVSHGSQPEPKLYDLIVAFENKIYNKLNRSFYPVLEKEVLKNVDKFQKSAEGAVFDKDPTVTLCMDLTSVIFEVLGKRAGQEALDALEVKEAFDFTESAHKIIEAQNRRFATVTTDTAYNRIKNVIDQGLSNNKPVLQIKKEIRQEFTALKNYQAERIARTEVSRTFHLSQIEAWKQTDFIEGKKWVLDGQPCSICEEASKMFGKTGVPLDMPFYEKNEVITDKFTNSYDDCISPPLHPNCKCGIAPVIIERKDIDIEAKTLDDLDKLLGE